MSHVVSLELEVRDLPALQQAARDLGGTLVMGQKTFRWYGTYFGVKAGDPSSKCDHAITHPDCSYDIGLARQPNGSYRLLADEWRSGGLRELFGPGLSKLKQRYGVVVATRTMRQQGYMVRERLGVNGDVRLVCTK